MAECSRPRRGMIMVASHFRSALPLATEGTQEWLGKGEDGKACL